MAEDMEKKNGQNQDQYLEDLKKVTATAEAKQMRHRVDEYIAMVIALTAVGLLWLLQFIGLY